MADRCAAGFESKSAIEPSDVNVSFLRWPPSKRGLGVSGLSLKQPAQTVRTLDFPQARPGGARFRDAAGHHGGRRRLPHAALQRPGSEPCPNAAQQCGSRSGRTEYIAGWFVHGLLGVSFCDTVQNISIIGKSASVPFNRLAQGARIGAR